MTKSGRAGLVMAFLSCAVLIVCLGSHSFARQSQLSAASTQAAIIQLENRWLANEYHPDALNQILADDFVHVLPQGFITKRQHINFVQTHPQPRLAVHKFEKLEVRVYGGVAIATGIVFAQRAGGGAPQRTFFTDVFAFRNGQWQAVNAQETLAQQE